MSGLIPASSSIDATLKAPVPAPAVPVPKSQSPAARAWRRFRRNRLGFVSLVIFATLVVLSLFAEVFSSDQPLLVRYEGRFYFPMVHEYSELTFGGDFPPPADYLDPYIRKKLSSNGNWV